tara:strand:- start:503 stop:787 length:285 start_codon:yes stop_codon:yes gene_type:complete
MIHYLYILHSQSIDKYYVGESADVNLRLDLHNSHHFKKGFTNAASDWAIKLTFECSLKNDALYLEKFIKRMKSKKFTMKIIDDPNILNDILSKK